MAAASSEATEQLLTSARACLLQMKTLLVIQSDEGANRLRDAQILPVRLPLMLRGLKVNDLYSNNRTEWHYGTSNPK